MERFDLMRANCQIKKVLRPSPPQIEKRQALTFEGGGGYSTSQVEEEKALKLRGV